MYLNEGFSSLYRGVLISSVAGSIANSVFFYVYQHGKHTYGFDKDKPYGFQTILLSLRAGLVAMAVTTPVWTLKTRMALYQ